MFYKSVFEQAQELENTCLSVNLSWAVSLLLLISPACTLGRCSLVPTSNGKLATTEIPPVLQDKHLFQFVEVKSGGTYHMYV
jgi:hypothetical protein